MVSLSRPFFFSAVSTPPRTVRGACFTGRLAPRSWGLHINHPRGTSWSRPPRPRSEMQTYANHTPNTTFHHIHTPMRHYETLLPNIQQLCHFSPSAPSESSWPVTRMSLDDLRTKKTPSETGAEVQLEGYLFIKKHRCQNQNQNLVSYHII